MFLLEILPVGNSAFESVFEVRFEFAAGSQVDGATSRSERAENLSRPAKRLRHSRGSLFLSDCSPILTGPVRRSVPSGVKQCYRRADARPLCQVVQPVTVDERAHPNNLCSTSRWRFGRGSSTNPARGHLLNPISGPGSKGIDLSLFMV